MTHVVNNIPPTVCRCDPFDLLVVLAAIIELNKLNRGTALIIAITASSNSSAMTATTSPRYHIDLR
jgi:hypothetical protein